MALDISSRFRKHPVKFSLLASVALLLTATTTHAGFEWVPAPKKPQAQQPAMPAVPPAAVDKSQAEPPSQDDLFLPEDQSLSPLPQDQLAAPAPASDNVIRTKTFAAPPSERAPLSQPPAPEHVLELPPQQKALVEDEAPVSLSPQDMARQQAMQDAAPAVMPAPAPIKTHVIVPEDAPESARRTLPPTETPLQIQPLPLPPPQEDALESAPDLAEPPSAAPMQERAAAPQLEAAELEAQPLDAPAPTQPFSSIEGFGSDMPLALALREIVPDGFAYSFGRGVDPGMRTSWNGGKPWPDVIRDMIEPLGLRAELNNNVMVIRSNTQGSVQAPPAVEPASGAKTGSKKPEGPEGIAADMYSLRRQTISDPGEQKSAQPSQTLNMAKELGLDTSGAPQPLLPPEAAAQTDAQKMESQEQQALVEVARPEGALNTPQKALSAASPASTAAEPLNNKAQASAEHDAVLAIEPTSGEAQTSEAATSVKTLWEAQKGDSLKRTLDDWSKKANVDLVWESSHDYTINSDILVTGDLKKAIKMVFSEGLNSDKAPMITFIAQKTKDQPGKVIIQDGPAG